MGKRAEVVDLTRLRVERGDPDIIVTVRAWSLGDGRFSYDGETRRREDVDPEWVKRHAPLVLRGFAAYWQGGVSKRGKRHRVRPRKG